MVILITGATHTGKTMLAQKLLEKYKIPYLSIDHLKMGLIRSGHTSLTPQDDAALTGYLWPIVREMVKTAVENGQHLIVEGCYIPFDWRRDFSQAYLLFIRFIGLVMTDGYIDARFDDILRHGCDIEKRLDETCSPEALKRDNRFYREGFETHGLPFTLIETDYQSAIQPLLDIDGPPPAAPSAKA